MKKTFLYFFCALTGVLATAQNVDLPIEYVKDQMMGRNELPKEVKGSPFLQEQFQPGEVQIGNKRFETLLRYNSFRDHFEIKNENGETGNLKGGKNVTISIGDIQYRYFTYYNKDEEKDGGYLNVLVDGETKFLKEERTAFRSAKKARSSYGQDEPAEFEPYVEYYIMENGKLPQHVRLKRRSILKVLGNGAVKEYVKQKDLNLRKEKDAIRLIQYYNTLQ